MHCNNWIFDMDGTLTDSMTVVWEGAPDALLARYGRTPKSDLHKTLLTMGMADGAAYLIREYDLPLKMEDYNDHKALRDRGAQARRAGAAGPPEGRGCPHVHLLQHLERPVPHRAHPFGHR